MSERRQTDPFDEDLYWWINDAPAALGERGVSQDPSGGGGRTLADNWVFLERAHAARGAVARARRLESRWRKLSPRQQNVLCAYYTARQRIPVTGAVAAFGSYARVALLVVGDGRERLVEALSDQQNTRHVPVVTEARRRARGAVREAHRAWAEGRREELEAWVEGQA